MRAYIDHVEGMKQIDMGEISLADLPRLDEHFRRGAPDSVVVVDFDSDDRLCHQYDGYHIDSRGSVVFHWSEGT